MFGNLMSALQDPEFMEKLQSMPQEIVDKLNSIESKLDILLALTGVDVEAVLQQNSNAANLQISNTAISDMEHPDSTAAPSINPVDPDSYK